MKRKKLWEVLIGLIDYFIIDFLYCFTGIGLIVFHSIILTQLIIKGCTSINPYAPALYLILFSICYAIKQKQKK